MNYQRDGISLPVGEISIGIDKLLRDYSIESIHGQLSQIDNGTSSLSTLVEPLTDFHVAHRRAIIDEEYSQFLDAIQSRSPRHDGLYGERSERQSSSHIQSTELIETIQPSPAFNPFVSRPELNPVDHLVQQLVSADTKKLLLQNGIQLFQDATYEAILPTTSKIDRTTFLSQLSDSSFNIGDLTSSSTRGSKDLVTASLDKSEKYYESVNSRSEFRPISPEWLIDAVTSARNTSQIVREIASSRYERLASMTDERLSSKLSLSSSAQRSSPSPDSQTKLQRLVNENAAPNATRAYVNLEKREITVVKQGERPIMCKLEVNTAKPTPVGSYCIRNKGAAQITTSDWRTLASPYQNFGAIVSEVTSGKFMQNSLRSEWHLLEPQFNTDVSRINLHPGTLSEGCVTVTDNQCYSKIAALLASSESFLGYGTNGKSTTNNPQNVVTCVGILTVTNSGQEGEVVRSKRSLIGLRSDYSLGVNVGGAVNSGRSNYNLGVSRSYEFPNSVKTDSSASQNRGYSLGVRLPEVRSIESSPYSPDVFKERGQPKQSAPSDTEPSKSNDGGSRGEPRDSKRSGVDSRGGAKDNSDGHYDRVGGPRTDNIA